MRLPLDICAKRLLPLGSSRVAHVPCLQDLEQQHASEYDMGG